MFKSNQEAKIPVILVNECGKQIGLSTKEEVHKNGLLHLAFSVFIRHEVTGKLLIQRRAAVKYHAPGLWSNTCCGHPAPGGASIAAQAAVRLQQEMGLSLSLTELGSFRYFHQFSETLFEHEFDHVLEGVYSNENICPNPEEVDQHRWMSVEELLAEKAAKPKSFSPWFFMALDCYLLHRKI